MVVSTSVAFVHPAQLFTKSVHPPAAQPLDLDPSCEAATRDQTSYNDQIFVWNHPEMSTFSISAKLFQSAKPMALRCLYHPFVHGLATGQLRQESFQNYVGQDFFFLHGFADAYKKSGQLSAAKGDENGVKRFKVLEQGVAEELELHQGYASKWGVDLSAVEAQATTRQYVDFVQAIASDQQAKPPADAKISHLCAALAPCMRLYAYLGQQLRAAGHGTASVDDNPYVEWVHTYSADDFEQLALTLEELLDHYAAAEGVTVADLQPIYNGAMELEFRFFDASPGVDNVRITGMQPSLLAVDFDQTLTEADTTNVIVKASMEAMSDAKERAEQERRFNELASGFYQAYNDKVAATLPEADSAAFDLAGLTDFARAMAEFDRASLAPVVKGHFLAGIPRSDLRRRGAAIQLQPGALGVLRAASDQGVHISIVSVNWSNDLIAGALGDQFISDLRAPNLHFESEVSTGQLSGIATAVDKLREMEDLIATKGAVGPSVYVGDSITDVLAMLRADYGVVVGSSGSLRRLLSKFNVQLRPLVASLGRGRQEGVLYHAESWTDVSLALFGTPPREDAVTAPGQ